MTLVPVKNLGQGLNKDQMPEEMTLGVWSGGYNVRVRNGSAERFSGIEAIFTPSFDPYYLDCFASSTTRFGVYAGLSAIACHDGTTETVITGAWTTGTADDRITGGAFQGSYLFNNGTDDPVYWNGSPASACAAFPAWPSGWTADVIRPFREFIFALSITRSGVKEPHTYAFSTAAQPGTMPASWTAAATNQAGDNFVVSPGELVDGVAHNDAFYLFKSASVWELRWTGGNYVFSRTRVPGSGMLAPNCGISTPVGMVVLTAGDVVLHSGLQEQSIANGYIRDWIFQTMNRDNWGRCFVCQNPSKFEVLVCFPSIGKASCDRAAVWNWADRTWSIRYLPDATCGGHGQIPASVDTDTWSLRTEPWSEAGDDDLWVPSEYAPNDARLVLGTISGHGNGLFDQGNTDFGVAITSRMECRGVHLDDPQRVKLLKGIYLMLDAVDGAQVTVQPGSAMLPDAQPTWKAVKAFTKGTSQKVDCFTSGRYLAYRIGSSGRLGWRIRSMQIDVEPQGLF
jgi:hypothetical protein